jgi:UDP-N-acetylglucosamine/UDP-N-acetylgalactosamine diphosphorylase
MEQHKQKLEILRQQGVEIPAPDTLEIGDDVKLEQIRGPKTILHMGTKLYGERLMILAGTRIGYEEPATLENCAIGRDVQLKGGSYVDAVFLDRVVMGKGAQVRKGTLMEEEANGAHTVGLKQTVLLPFVTLGSLINFCDILMAGGTSRRDHSEVGSSFIHFNFTPFGKKGDKATPSLIGDVPRGVMLRSKRIFLGGQGGLVGPLNIDYGTVLAAGFVYRRDHGPDELVVSEKLSPRVLPFNHLRYNRIRDKVTKNLAYIGNLIALWHWYERVRCPVVAKDDPELARLYRRGQGAIKSGIKERIKRLGVIASYMEDSIEALSGSPQKQEIRDQQSFADNWPSMKEDLEQYSSMGQIDTDAYQTFERELAKTVITSRSYIEIIRALEERAVFAGTAWLEGIVNHVMKIGV